MKNRNVLLVVVSSILIIVGILFIGLTSAAEDDMREQAKRRIELKQKSSNITQSVISFHIDDRTEICTGERELIYTDNQFNYYLPCFKSTTIYLVYYDHEITLKDALSTNTVTIGELINNGLEVTKEAV